MSKHQGIEESVNTYYWKENINCAATSLKILGEYFSVKLTEQVIHSAAGMHGAGGYGAQCGLVEGPLLFIGIYGKEHYFTNKQIEQLCYGFAAAFEQKFGSLLCSDLRPGGFNNDDPEHLCEKLTVEAVEFTVSFLKNTF